MVTLKENDNLGTKAYLNLDTNTILVGSTELAKIGSLSDGTTGFADGATLDAATMLDLSKSTQITENAGGVALINQLASAFGLSVEAPKTTVTVADVGTTLTDMNNFEGVISLDASNAVGAQNLLQMSDSLIAYVDGARADLGAIQNRMESTIRNQSNIMENTTDARSRIRDTDFAAETANLTQQSIIQQAASSMLMQANQRPQMALSLLG